MSDDLPPHMRHFLPERDPEPTPADLFDAYLAEHEADEPLPRRLPLRERVADDARFYGLLALVCGGIAGLLWLTSGFR